MATTQKQPQVKTARPARKEQAPGATPRLPHEHDESHDSQVSGPREDMRQAHSDLEHGLVDTDMRGVRGVEEVKKASKKTPRTVSRKGAHKN